MTQGRQPGVCAITSSDRGSNEHTHTQRENGAQPHTIIYCQRMVEKWKGIKQGLSTETPGLRKCHWHQAVDCQTMECGQLQSITLAHRAPRHWQHVWPSHSPRTYSTESSSHFHDLTLGLPSQNMFASRSLMSGDEQPGTQASSRLYIYFLNKRKFNLANIIGAYSSGNESH